MRRRRAGVAVVGMGVLVAALTACSSPADELETECRQAVADHVGVEIDEVTTTETYETPGGSLDWRGTYPGGEFACGAGLNPDEIYQVIVFSPDGLGDVIVG